MMIIKKDFVINAVIALFVLFEIVTTFVVADDPQLLRDIYGSPTSPTGSATGARSCAMDSNEQYAVCGSLSTSVLKFNLQPFAFAAAGTVSTTVVSCGLYETMTQSTSRAVCSISSPTLPKIRFYKVSDMSLLATITSTSSVIGEHFFVAVNTANRTAYVSTYLTTPTILKIIDIDTATPTIAQNMTLGGFGDRNTFILLLVGNFLYVRVEVGYYPRLARVRLSDFTWNGTVNASGRDGSGWLDQQLATDGKYVYMSFDDAEINRFGYNNTAFWRVDSLKGTASVKNCTSISISPDNRYLFGTGGPGSPIVFMVDLGKFAHVSFAGSLPYAWGKPIVTSDKRVFTFDDQNKNVYMLTYGLNYSMHLHENKHSPLRPGSNVLSPRGCKANPTNSYAVCASTSNKVIKFNLSPIAVLATSAAELDKMYSCDLWNGNATAASRVVCAQGTVNPGVVFFYYAANLSKLTALTVSISATTGPALGIVVDQANAVAYVTACDTQGKVYKIGGIDGNNPTNLGFVKSNGAGDVQAYSPLLQGGYFFTALRNIPPRLSRFVLTPTFTWDSTVDLLEGTNIGIDCLVADDTYIYVLLIEGIITRCTYGLSNFSRVDSLHVGLSDAASLAISPFNDILFATSTANNTLFMVTTSDFLPVAGGVSVPSCNGRPIILKNKDVFAFSDTTDYVYLFNYDFTESFSESLSITSGKTTSVTRSVTSAKSASAASTTASHANTKTPSFHINPSWSSDKSKSKSDDPSSASSSMKPTLSTSRRGETPSNNLTESSSAASSRSKSHSPDASRTYSRSNMKVAKKTRTLSQELTATQLSATKSQHITESASRRRQHTATLNNITAAPPKPAAVVAPAPEAASASVAAAVGGVVGGDVAAPTVAARALSLAAVATACQSGVTYIPAPPTDEPLPWPQGSLIPQIQIALPNDDPKDAWRKHYRGAILANFVAFPLVVLAVVVVIVYSIRSTSLQHRIAATYLFSITKGTKAEHRDPDLLADSRIFGVMLFLFGLGLEGASCAFVTLLTAPRATSASLGIDIFLALLAVAVIAVSLGLLMRVILGAKERLECVPTDIRFKGGQTMSEDKVKAARILYGHLGWTYRGTLESDEKIEEAKRYFLRYRNLFATNQGPHDDNDNDDTRHDSKKKTTTAAARANAQVNDDPNTFARRISMYAAFVDCALTVLTGLVRGLALSGVLACSPAIVLLLVVQLVILVWNVAVRGSLYPITKFFNILMAFLLACAALATLLNYQDAGKFAVSIAMVLSFVGMAIVLARLLIRKVYSVLIYPKRESFLVDGEKIKTSTLNNNSVAANELQVSLIDVNHGLFSDDEVGEDDRRNYHLQTEMTITAPQSPQNATAGVLEASSMKATNNNNNHHQLGEEDDDIEIDLSMLLPNAEAEASLDNVDDDDEIVIGKTNVLGDFIIDLNATNDDDNENNDDNDLYKTLMSDLNEKSQGLVSDDDDHMNLIDGGNGRGREKLTAEAFEGSQAYEAESREMKVSKLLAQLDDDEEVAEAVHKRKEDEERRRKKTMTEEMKNETLKKIQAILKRSA